MLESANAATAAQTNKRKAAKKGSKQTVEATADDTEGTSKAEEPATGSKGASQSADDASQLPEYSQVRSILHCLLFCILCNTLTGFQYLGCMPFWVEAKLSFWVCVAYTFRITANSKLALVRLKLVTHMAL